MSCMSEMRIGITGTIGSGKSTVLKYFDELGFVTFDCDAYNRELLKKGNKGYLLVKEHFPEVLIKEEIDRKLLAKLIFADRKKRELLESLLHPLIIEGMATKALAAPLFFAEVPLLYEKGLQAHFDLVILVTTADELALKRLAARGISEDEARKRLAAQMPFAQKAAMADVIVYNNGGIIELHHQLDDFLNSYVRKRVV